jgi:uncharacterized protein YegP (UPF0339 family)
MTKGEEMATFKIYKDTKGEYRWRFRADNNKIVADSAEGYNNKADCEHGIDLVKKQAPTATVTDETAATAKTS